MDGVITSRPEKILWFAFGLLTMAAVYGAGSLAGGSSKQKSGVISKVPYELADTAPVSSDFSGALTVSIPLYSDYASAPSRQIRPATRREKKIPAAMTENIIVETGALKRETGSDSVVSEQSHFRFTEAVRLPGGEESDPAMETAKNRLLEAEFKVATLRKTLTDRHPELLTALEEADASRRQFEAEVTRRAREADRN